MTYTDVADTYIYYIRVDFDPVGIKFCADEAEISKYKINAKAKAKLTYCQHLAMARGGHKAMFMPANMLLCENAEPVFGFRELDKEKDTKRHMKYLRNEELAWQAPQGKAKLPLGKCYGIYTAPLADFDESGIDPDIVYLYAAARTRLTMSSTTTWPPTAAAASPLIIRPIRRCAPVRYGPTSITRPI